MDNTATYATAILLIAFISCNICTVNSLKDDIEHGARVKRQQNGDDVTTVLLVDNNGQHGHGRYINLKPTIGLLTSTARTFIQEGVTTEYATQVLGTTLDNGRLYAQFLTKSSRVIYDHNDTPATKASYQLKEQQNPKWNFDNNLVLPENVNIIKNTDYITPNKADAYLVFPTTRQSPSPSPYKLNYQKFASYDPHAAVVTASPWAWTTSAEDEDTTNPTTELPEQLPTPRAQVQQNDGESDEIIVRQESKTTFNTNNVKTFKANPAAINLENYYKLKESQENDIQTGATSDTRPRQPKQLITPSKVRPQGQLPTFTIKNEFSPSGFDYQEDRDRRAGSSNKNKQSDKETPADRKAKLLFRGGVKQDLKDLETVTYYGFADFTTIVGDTVIVFSPSTTQDTKLQGSGQITSISGEATLSDQNVATTVKTFYSHEPGMVTKTVTGHKFNMHTSLPTMVIDASNRQRDGKSQDFDDVTTPSEIDEAAKSSVLAQEQDINKEYDDIIIQSTPEFTESDIATISSSQSTETLPSAEVIQPSEVLSPTLDVTQMLSKPSDEDIARIVASLAANAQKQKTEPLVEGSATTIFDSVVEDDQYSVAILKTDSETHVLGGATTIFFEDDPFLATDFFNIKSTSPVEATTQSTAAITTTEDQNNAETTTTSKAENSPTTIDDQNKPVETTTSSEKSTEKELSSVVTTESNENSLTTTSKAVEKEDEDENNEVDFSKQNEDDQPVKCTPTNLVETSTLYKTYTYLTTFFIPVDDDITTTSIKSHEVTSTEIDYNTIIPTYCESIVPTSTSSTPDIESTVDVNTLTTTSAQQDSETTESVTTTVKASSEQPTTVDNTKESIQTTTEEQKPTTIDDNNDKITTLSDESIINTTPIEVITTESSTDDSHDETTTENHEDGVDYIYKTLYTTYNYLTTFYLESTTSISSRKVIITNVITSTINPSKSLQIEEATDPAVAGLFARDDSIVGNLDEDHNSVLYSKPAVSFDDLPEIAPTSVGIGRPTTSASFENTSDDDILSEPTEDNLLQATPALNGIKTYYTTYTYFTTIFVDGETEISSRTAVYTNYVTPTQQENVSATSISNLTTPEEDDNEDEQEIESTVETNVDDLELTDSSREKIMNLNLDVYNKYNSTIVRNNNKQLTIEPTTVTETTNEFEKTNDNAEKNYSTMLRSKEPNTSEEEQDEDDILIETHSSSSSSSTSSSQRITDKLFDNVEKRNILEDQISSESNNNDSELMPSPTLLLQTSYTTFTYFTTMYLGTTSSNVVSRLETVTNIVTETIQPSQITDDSATIDPSAAQLPITYFTTFTYWTTLFKDGVTTTTSREQTVSSIYTPTATLPAIEIEATQVEKQELETFRVGSKEEEKEINPTTTATDDLTTIYTTYTFYTTSYIDDETIINSRLETVTSIQSSQIEPSSTVEIEATPTVVVTNEDNSLLPTGLISTIISTNIEDDKTILYSTDVYGTYINGLYAKILESTTKTFDPESSTSSTTSTNSVIAPSSTAISSQQLKPTGIVSINQGKIIDAEGISTLFFTTKAIGTYVDNLYAQVVQSTSSLSVDEVKKSQLPVEQQLPQQKRTGLVRLIDGTIVQNHTTTLYQSKVLGTIIDGRYAQIIESTSSFIIEKTTAPSTISPSATLNAANEIKATASPTSNLITPSPVTIESSLSDDIVGKNDDENRTDQDDDEQGRKKSRLTFSTRKRTFTPVIRPFAIRNRPTFAPKRKNIGPSSAQTITRSDFTPTITATPAIKTETTRGRFSGTGGRRNNQIIAPSSQQNAISPSSNRKFSRQRGGATSATFQASSSSFSGRRSSSRVQPTATGGYGSSSRRGGFRTSIAVSSPVRSSASNIFASSSRFRVRPTQVLSSSLYRGASSRSYTTPSTDTTDQENDLTTIVTDDPTSSFADDEYETTLALTSTTESQRRQNPLLRFRRPLNRPGISPVASTPRTGTTSRRNTRRTTTTTTTTTTLKPKGRPFRPPPSIAPQNRARPSNSLFPRRELFKPRTSTTEEPKAEEIQDGDEEFEDEEGFDDGDNEYEGSQKDTQTEVAPVTINRQTGKVYNAVQVRPFIRRRVKRQIDYGSRSTPARFRRPNGARAISTPIYEEIYESSELTTPSPPSIRTTARRFSGRTRNNPTVHPPTTLHTPFNNQRPKISPSRPTPSTARSQFTLRERDTTPRSNFRRGGPTTAASRRTTGSPQANTRPKPPRLRGSYGITTETPRRSTARSRNVNRRGGTTQRTRGRVNSYDDYSYVAPSFDGTITVTHHIPTEVTIPVVNGKITEYKNIITAKLSTEILGPNQYLTSTGFAGNPILVLTSEATGLAANGATEITQFILHETPTTSVTFTPTYIRGRKTSFSHIIPSTVYDVEQVVSTITPPLAAQAPLANILLSQLLLGNLGVPNQNPLLGLQNPLLGAQNAVPQTPTTEYKTRTTTYVTTVTSATSTIIPLTFRGKEILTTIVDSSENVITATEFITDTVVVTPTAALPNANINSLLLPLLQQQLQPQTNPFGQQQQLTLLQDPNQFYLQDLEQKKQLLNSDELRDIRELDKLKDQDVIEDDENLNDNLYDLPPTQAPARRKPPSSRTKPTTSKPKPAPVRQSSVVTIYVSGRRPGEFSTSLSTVYSDEEYATSTLRKREIDHHHTIQVEPSRLPTKFESKQIADDLEKILLSGGFNDIVHSSEEMNSGATESLESVVGDLTKYYNLNTQTVETLTNHLNSQSSSSDRMQSTLTEDPHIEFTPKVETIQRGDINFNLTNFNCNYNLNNVSMNSFTKFGTSQKLRLKRDVSDAIGRNVRIVKKLVAKRKLETSEITPTKSRRVVVRTHRRKLGKSLQFPEETNLISSTQQHRRKVIVTRKRLLIQPTETLESIVATTSDPTPSELDLEIEVPPELYLQNTDEQVINKTKIFASNNLVKFTTYIEPNISLDPSLILPIPTAIDRAAEEDIPSFTTLSEPNTSLEPSLTLPSEEETTAEEEDPSLQTVIHITHDPVTIFPSDEYTELSSPTPSSSVLPLLSTSLIYETKELLFTKLRTYTFVVTRVNGDEQIVTSTTSIKPQIKTTAITNTLTTILTILPTETTVSERIMTTVTNISPSLIIDTKNINNINKNNTNLTTIVYSSDFDALNTSTAIINEQQSKVEADEEDIEARGYNLATRIMSNGVEVIVAGDKSTIPGDPNYRRVLKNTQFKPVTLAPSTLRDHMMLLSPQEATKYPNQFVTKTCMTTFTYLTTWLQDGTTTVSSHEQVISNIATEERNTAHAHIAPTSTAGITLTQNPNLATGVFHTTYTYLNTMHDGDQPLVVTSKHTVANTVTAPDDYLSLLQPSETATPVHDTNTYYSTVSLTKTLIEGTKSEIISTEDVITQVVITESIPPKATSVMTSYIALDVEDIAPTATKEYSTTDVVKTYFVTYTYYNTFMEDGSTVVKTNVSTSSDIVTEKLYLYPKRTQSTTSGSAVIKTNPVKSSASLSTRNTGEPLEIFATKTYLTTFTYFTTLLQENGAKDSTTTIISSRTRVVENVITESIATNLFKSDYIDSLRTSVKNAGNEVVQYATMLGGEELEITAVDHKQEHTKIAPTATSSSASIVATSSHTAKPITKSTTKPSKSTTKPKIEPTILEPSTPSVITGSTIIFFDEDDQIDQSTTIQSKQTSSPTPPLNFKPTKSAIVESSSRIKTKNNSKTKINKSTTHKLEQTKTQSVNSNTKAQPQNYTTSILSSKTVTKNGATLMPGDQVIVVNRKNGTKTIIPVSDPSLKKPANKNEVVQDLLSLGSLGINSLTALRPVFSAIGGMIKNNLNSNRRNDTSVLTNNTTLKPQYADVMSKKSSKKPPATALDAQNRSPIYIPVGSIGDDGLEVAESQNIASHLALNGHLLPDQKVNHKNQVIFGKPTYESPLVNGGIPISPGQVITANSDVIVGKPAIVGPRVPFLENKPETPIGMQPPPKLAQKEVINDVEKHKRNPDTYYGPPPPLKESSRRPLIHIENSNYHDNKPLSPPPFKKMHTRIRDSHGSQSIRFPNIPSNREDNLHLSPPPIPKIPPPSSYQEVNHAGVSISHKHQHENSGKVVHYGPTRASESIEVRPITIGDPHLLPEVVERATGQPLLVNIQPSQVANVIIPPGSSTALIFGGISEPHKNGQYFDDPSPYPEPETTFTGINPPTHKVMPKPSGGVINVDSNTAVHGIDINVPPLSFGVSPNENPVNVIKPSGSIISVDSHVNHHDISVNVPPISFGTVINEDIHTASNTHHYEGESIKSQVIHHGVASHGIKINAPPVSFGVSNYDDEHRPNHGPIKPGVVHNDYGPHDHGITINEQKVSFGGPNHDLPPYGIKVHLPHMDEGNININVSPQPLGGINSHEHVVPNGIVLDAPLNNNQFNTRPGSVASRPSIPLNNYDHSVSFVNSQSDTPNSQWGKPQQKPLLPPKQQNTPSEFMSPPPISQPNKKRPEVYHSTPKPIPLHSNEDDLPSDENVDQGESVQESNQYPLRPGQLPINKYTTLKPLTTKAVQKKPADNFTIINDIIHAFDTSLNDQKIGQVFKIPMAHDDLSYNIPKPPISNVYKKPPTRKPIIERPTTHRYNNKYHNVHPTSLPVDNSHKVGTRKPPVTNNYESKENTGSQTEKPFNTAYTKPPDHKQAHYATTTPRTSLHLDNSPSSNIQIKSNTSNILNNSIVLPHSKPVNPLITLLNKEKLDLNLGEIPKPPTKPSKAPSNIPNKPHNGSEDSDIIMSDDEKSELFVTKESTNPHNYGSVQINQTVDPSSLEKMHPPTIENIYDKMKNMDMDMKPPPPVQNTPTITPEKPLLDTQSVITPSSFIPKPSEEMKPPPAIEYHSQSSIKNDDIVMGLNPPPAVTAHTFTETTPQPEISTYRPVFNIDHYKKRPNLNRYPQYSTTTKATEIVQNVSRRPQTPSPPRATKRPESSTKKAPVTPDHYPITTRRPAFSWPKPRPPAHKPYVVPPIRHPQGTTVAITFSPTSSHVTPSMDIIIGKPEESINPTHVKEIFMTSKVEPSIPTWNPDSILESSETLLTVDSMNIIKTSLINDVQEKSVPVLVSDGITTIFGNLFTKDSNSEIISGSTIRDSTPSLETTMTHHAGNEVKIVDESIQPTSSNTPIILPTIIEEDILQYRKETSKSLLPTRYITHTQTLTVTTTKTTVVKSLGAPPSTLTLLLTKTQTSTIVDTVTETYVHTLVQPTSIVSTITTTINHHIPQPTKSSTYPQKPEPTTYPSVPVATSIDNSSGEIVIEGITDEENLNDFIIDDNEPPPNVSKPNITETYNDNESIFVVMTDKNKGGVVKVPPHDDKNDNKNHKDGKIEHGYETEQRDEIVEGNDIDHVMVGGILIATPPRLEIPDINGRLNECKPDCKPSRNELCQRVEGIMRCVCRPGFARMFPDRPCKPTYTYRMKIALARHGKERLRYVDKLNNENSNEFTKLAQATHDGLDRMVMQSDLRDVYHGVHVDSFEPTPSGEGVINKFYVQLSDNTDEGRLMDVFKKYLRNNNYSLGGTEVYAAREYVEQLQASDFNECMNPQFHDCSEHAECFNLRGTYTCSCKEGFADLSENPLYPGRVCSAELIGCEKCNYHGTCYNRGDEQVLCECFQWYAGQNCHINLKVMLIGLIILGIILFILLIVCSILTCVRHQSSDIRVNSHRGSRGAPRGQGGTSFLPQRASLDRRAMIQDTSSEGSQSDANTLPYVVKKSKKQKSSNKKHVSVADLEQGDSGTLGEQRDRSLTVMIPRAKYHPAAPNSPLMTMGHGYEKRKTSAGSTEAKLLSYLDAGPSPNRQENPSRKHSQAQSERKSSTHKNSTGALVSAGFEVSATVGSQGVEADRSENATLIHKADLISSTGTRSQFTTLRKSTSHEDLVDPMANWLVDTTPRVMTVSEARSYDETTIQPPTKSLRSVGGYDSKPSSHHNNEEANTMAERDVGSTFLLPHTHLYKPDRGSDISGFDSL
ncbi:uncharacterized protein LOC123298838 [Chrysoperla carnea]|uniref:uncharacterized protein LOC123298838 n=1 Tax=Chrysoperla carnea TaxID=189513 RepID=UPI001D08EC93|nr:uncharacterized protein LOC123298838 [Chrysoperla carnea]